MEETLNRHGVGDKTIVMGLGIVYGSESILPTIVDMGKSSRRSLTLRTKHSPDVTKPRNVELYRKGGIIITKQEWHVESSVFFLSICLNTDKTTS